MQPLDLELCASTLLSLPVAVWVGRAPGCELVYANAAYEKMTGEPPRIGEAPGSGSLAFHAVSGATYPRAKLPFRRAVETGLAAVADDMVIHRRDGERVHVRAFANPLFDSSRTITHVVVTFVDITTEVQAGRGLTLTKERLATAVDHAPIILFSFDRTGRITLSEGAGLSALGLRSGELVGRSVYDLYQNHPIVLENTRRALAGESFTSVDEVGDASLETWLSPLRDSDGGIVGAIGVATDVTNRRRLEAKALLADRVMAMGRLSASVAHEINNPLTYMMISLARMDEESLRMAQNLEVLGVNVTGAADALTCLAKLRELLALAREGAERVRVVTQDLRSFSRPDDERTQSVDIRRVAESLLSLVSKETESRARLVADLQPVARVTANEARLLQVFLNLLRNASQAFPDADPVHQEIRVSTRQEGSMVVFEVADNGPGVSKAIRDRIFEPFFTTKPVGEGTGLGLFVSRNIARELGGDVVALDSAGGGATFRVLLPADPHGEAAVPFIEPVRDSSRMRAVSRGRILIVDDNARIGRMLEESLAPHHDVRLATSGKAGIDLVSSQPPFDLIFCELMMRGIGGMDFYAELRRIRPGSERKIVFMSGGVMSERARAFLGSVENDRLIKPFDIVDDVRKRLA